MRPLFLIFVWALALPAAGQDVAPDDIVDDRDPVAEPPADDGAPDNAALDDASDDPPADRAEPTTDDDRPADGAAPEDEGDGGRRDDERYDDERYDDERYDDERYEDERYDDDAVAEDEGAGWTPWIIGGVAVAATGASVAAFMVGTVLSGIAGATQNGPGLRPSAQNPGPAFLYASLVPHAVALLLIGPVGALGMTLTAVGLSAILDDDGGRTGWTGGAGLLGLLESVCGAACFVGGTGSLFVTYFLALLQFVSPLSLVGIGCGLCGTSCGMGMCVTSTLVSGVSSAIANGVTAGGDEAGYDDGPYDDDDPQDGYDDDQPRPRGSKNAAPPAPIDDQTGYDGPAPVDDPPPARDDDPAAPQGRSMRF